MRVALLGLLLALACAATAHAETVWLCQPGETPNPCAGSLETTGAPTPDVPAHPKVDCFYVYPTVSEQPGPNADKSKDPEVDAIALFQAARFSEHCRVFAPVYRQRTLLSIATMAPPTEVAYEDVLEAWRTYLAQADRGRGVVLVGHSQGTFLLRRLLREEIDPDPVQRRRIVSAALLGGNVVPDEFPHFPACTAAGQTGCVLAWSTFLDDPPENARFGPGAVCTNPGSLGANERTTFQSLVPSAPFPGVIGAGLLLTYGGAPPTAATPWLAPAERYAGRCETINGATVLKVDPVDGARRLNPFPEPGWGIHLTDVNIAFVQLLDVVGRQVATYTRPPLRIRATCRRGKLRVRVRGAERIVVRDQDRRRLRVRITLADGRKVTRRPANPCRGRPRR